MLSDQEMSNMFSGPGEEDVGEEEALSADQKSQIASAFQEAEGPPMPVSREATLASEQEPEPKKDDAEEPEPAPPEDVEDEPTEEELAADEEPEDDKEPDKEEEPSKEEEPADEESEEEHVIYLIAWDSVTLKEMDLESITRSEEEGLGWDSMYLYEEDIEPASPRDSEGDVKRAIKQIQQDLEQGFSNLTNKAV